MSNTTNKFLIGLISNKGQWIGEETLFQTKGQSDYNGPLAKSYSIIAKTKVVALEIRRSEFLSQLNSKEFMDKIKRNILERKIWVNQRFKECSFRSNEIQKMDKRCQKYDENLLEFTKKFPQATSHALTNFRRNHFREVQELEEEATFLSARGKYAVTMNHF